LKLVAASTATKNLSGRITHDNGIHHQLSLRVQPNALREMVCDKPKAIDTHEDDRSSQYASLHFLTAIYAALDC
jgi:hypothetical protein